MPGRGFPSVSLLPSNPGVLLRKLWESAPAQDGEPRASGLAAVLFTSATLGAPGHALSTVDRFRETAQALGVPVASNDRGGGYRAVGSVRAGQVWRAALHPGRPSVEPPVRGVDEDNRAILSASWLAYAVGMVQAAHAASGRTLVLTRSYRDNALLAAELQRLGLPIIEQRRGEGIGPCVVPHRFERAVDMAGVLLQSGEMLVP